MRERSRRDLSSEEAIGPFDIGGGGAPTEAKDFVVVLLPAKRRPRRRPRRRRGCHWTPPATLIRGPGAPVLGPGAGGWDGSHKELRLYHTRRQWNPLLSDSHRAGRRDNGVTGRVGSADNFPCPGLKKETFRQIKPLIWVIRVEMGKCTW